MTEDEDMLHLIESRCNEDGGCLLWPGTLASGTTPSLRKKGKNINARRRYYELKVGPIPEGMVVAVTCECQRCMRHIEAQTPGQVRQRVAATGVYSAAVHGPKIAAGRRKKSKYSEALIDEIRSSDEPQQSLADRVGMPLSYLKKIQRGVQRRRLDNPFAGLIAHSGLGARP